MSKLSPLNRLGVWIDRSWASLEQKSADFGKNYSLYKLFSRVGFLRSPKFLKFLSARLDRKTYQDSALRLNITDNSVLLYYNNQVGASLPPMRFSELIVPVLFLVRLKTLIPFLAYSLLMFLYQPFIVSASRLYVVRMDLLPHMEAIMFHKVGIFWTSRIEIVPIKNLVKLKFEHSKYDYYFSYVHGLDMLFTDTQTGQEYGFGFHGTWLDENLKHSLIN